MCLKDFFTPINTPLPPSHLSKNVRIYTSKTDFPSLQDGGVAFFTINEYRGAGIEKKDEYFSHSFRNFFYSLSTFETEIILTDLGNLLPQAHLKDTYKAIKIVCNELRRKNIIPFLIGGSHDIDFFMYRGCYQDSKKKVNFINTDILFDGYKNSQPSHSHSLQILQDEKPGIDSFSFLGFQRFLIEKELLSFLYHLPTKLQSIGEVRNNFLTMEAIIRSTDFLSFDLSVLKIFHPMKLDFGMTPEEACQLYWYAGLNEKLTSVGLFKDFLSTSHNSHHLANITAVMVWYFLNGVSQRIDVTDFQGSSYKKYVVLFKNKKEVTFYNSKLTGRWWVEGKNIFYDDKKMIFPCTIKDYEKATKGQYPEHIMDQTTGINKNITPPDIEK